MDDLPKNPEPGPYPCFTCGRQVIGLLVREGDAPDEHGNVIVGFIHEGDHLGDPVCLRWFPLSGVEVFKQRAVLEAADTQGVH